MKALVQLIFLLFFTLATTTTTNSSSFMEIESPIVNMYPNPARDYIKFNSEKDVSKIIFYNVIGNKIKEIVNPIEDDNIDVDSFNKGMYLVEFYSQDEKVITLQRLRKE